MNARDTYKTVEALVPIVSAATLKKVVYDNEEILRPLIQQLGIDSPEELAGAWPLDKEELSTMLRDEFGGTTVLSKERILKILEMLNQK